MSNTKPYIRKKAVLAMFKLYVKYPQGLRLTFDKLKDRLDDSETSVISTAVNVICELANKNPRNYLAMAPKFFKLLTSSSNNWMLIKVVKLLGSLVSEEPRLARKLLEPLAAIIQNTSAKSLQYECIYTLTEALPHSKRDDGSDAKSAPQVIKLCSDYLRGFIEESDQNLKYLGLVGLVRLMRSSPRSVVDQRDLILKCLGDDDVTIKSKALELLVGIVSKKSLIDLVRHLLEHARRAEGAYRDEIISKILLMCRQEKYSLISDFAWYISILMQLAVMQGSQHGGEVAAQLMEISLRVESVRPCAVEAMLTLLIDDRDIMGQARSTVCEVMRAAAWVLGEYSDIISLIVNDVAPDRESHQDDYDDEDDEEKSVADEREYWISGAARTLRRSKWRGQSLHVKVIDNLINPRSTTLPDHVQTVYLQSAMKIFVRACNDCEESHVSAIITVLRTRLSVFLQVNYFICKINMVFERNSYRFVTFRVKILKCKSVHQPFAIYSPSSGYCK
jgi:AP-3 complex subunit delta-1